jgi:hypothetical protein
MRGLLVTEAIVSHSCAATTAGSTLPILAGRGETLPPRGVVAAFPAGRPARSVNLSAIERAHRTGAGHALARKPRNHGRPVKPVAHSLSPGIGFALLCLYAAVALAAGGWALARRDA